MRFRHPLLVFLTLCGLLLNALLLFWKLTDPDLAVAGCGGGGCGSVLASRWSQWFGIPVVLPGVLVYLTLLVTLLWKKEGIAAFCYTVIAGAAVWLIFTQIVFLRQFCPWCMGAHAVGCLVAVLGLARRPWPRSFRTGLQAGAVASFALALGQLYGPVPAGYLITPAAPVKVGRTVTFDQGRKKFDVTNLPRFGSDSAPRVLVEYYDFRCPACRTMSGYLRALVDKHPDKVCVILLPVPLDRECNSSLLASDTGHPGSCDLSRIALAVWKTDPSVYQEVHTRFMADPPLDKASALEFVRKRVPSARIESALSDPWVDGVIRTSIADWVALSVQNRQLPKLLVGDKSVFHGLPPSEAEFMSVLEKVLGL